MTAPNATPVLDAARQLLKFKDNTTFAEIAGVAGVSRKVALETINRNGHMVWRDRKSGKITRVDPQSVLRDQLWKSGKFYRETEYDYGSTKGYVFEGNDELRQRLQAKTYGGGLGDSYACQYIPINDETRAVMHEAGLRPWSEAVIDDSAWSEAVERELERREREK